MTTDLDTQIRAAEMSVVESDRRLLQAARRLAPAARSSALRAAWLGAGSLAVVASTWLVVRSLSRPPPRSRRASRPHAARSRPVGMQVSPPARPRRRAMEVGSALMELGGALMGSALRSGLAPGASKAAAMPALAAGWRWLSRARGDRR